MVERAREIRSALNADASLRIDRMEREPPAYLRGRRDDNDAAPWRATVGAIEQFSAACGIDSGQPFGARPRYVEMTRSDQYRQLEHSIGELTQTRTRRQRSAHG